MNTRICKRGHESIVGKSCKLCIAIMSAKRRKRDVEKRAEYDRKNYLLKREEIKKTVKKYREENYEKVKERKHIYYIGNLEKIKKYNEKYRQENIEKVEERNRKWRKLNIEKVNGIKKRWKIRNIEQVLKSRRRYKVKKRYPLELVEVKIMQLEIKHYILKVSK